MASLAVVVETVVPMVFLDAVLPVLESGSYSTIGSFAIVIRDDSHRSIGDVHDIMVANTLVLAFHTRSHHTDCSTDNIIQPLVSAVYFGSLTLNWHDVSGPNSSSSRGVID